MIKIFLLAIFFSCSTASIQREEGLINNPYPMKLSLEKDEKTNEILMQIALVSESNFLPEKSLEIKMSNEKFYPSQTSQTTGHFTRYNRKYIFMKYAVTKELIQRMVQEKKVMLVVKMENNFQAKGNFSDYEEDKVLNNRTSAKEKFEDFLKLNP